VTIRKIRQKYFGATAKNYKDRVVPARMSPAEGKIASETRIMPFNVDFPRVPQEKRLSLAGRR